MKDSYCFFSGLLVGGLLVLIMMWPIGSFVERKAWEKRTVAMGLAEYAMTGDDIEWRWLGGESMEQARKGTQ